MAENALKPEESSGSKNGDLGVYRDLFSAKTQIEGQDGGVVTSLLLQGLKDGTFDSVIVVKRTEGYNAEAVATDKIGEVAAARGTKYLKVNVTAKLRELAQEGKKKIAVTCTPCEAKAVRIIIQALKEKNPDLDVTIIGLFCLESFNAAKLKQEVQRLLNVDLDRANKTEVRKGKFTIYIGNQEFSCRIRDLSVAAEKICHFCSDFTSTYADVSVGAVGSKPGYSTVMVRSAKGEELLKNLEATKTGVDKEEIVKLSKFKAERAQKSRLELKSQQ